MTEVNVVLCKNILSHVGMQLLNKYSGDCLPLDREEMIQRFTEANHWASNQIRMALENEYPNIRWSDSEMDLNKQKNPEFTEEYWICDPVDGAVHWLQGFSFWSISLCLIRNGLPVISMIFDPNRNEFFHAIAGKGAFLQGRAIRVSQKTNINTAVIATAPPSMADKDMDNTERTIQSVAALMPKVCATRMLGSVALQLAYVACGRLDGYWEFGDELYDWLAGALIVQEAGGFVTDIRGDKFTWGTNGIIAGASTTHELMKGEISKVEHGLMAHACKVIA